MWWNESERWLKPETRGSLGNRQTDRGTERGGGEGVKPQFLYVVWFQFGKSHHSPVHWGGKPDECVLECCWTELFFLFFFGAPYLLQKAPPLLLVNPSWHVYVSLLFNKSCSEEVPTRNNGTHSNTATDITLVGKSVTDWHTMEWEEGRSSRSKDAFLKIFMLLYCVPLPRLHLFKRLWKINSINCKDFS